MNTDDLIQGFLDGQLSADEAAELSCLLENDASARARYLDLAGLHATLMADETLRAPKSVLRPTTAVRPNWMRSITQMAAGVVLGGLAVSAVWAYALPRMPVSRVLPLVDGGFESRVPRSGQGVPREVGRWAGDPCEIVAEHSSVKPHEGHAMLRFIAANSDDDNQGGKRWASDLWQVIELPGESLRTVRVKAWFNAETSNQARFQIIAVAGDGDAHTAPDLWKQNYQVASLVPAASRSTVYVDCDPQTWQASELVLQVPASARILVICLSAFRQTDGFQGQLVDDVCVTIHEEEVLP